jgi:tRNA-dihydrouridine synthase B
MAGISDLPFRMLNRGFGAELAFVEMINCRSISHKSKRTENMLSPGPKEKPLGVQILGCEEKFILKALDVLSKYKFDLIDFNAACPAKKVVRRGEGASLLKEPKKINRLLKLIVKNSKLPVTAKIRIGWDKDSINSREVALYAQDAGIKALFVHGRTKAQGYSGGVDYKAVSLAKKAIDIPLIASGDILSAQLAKRMYDETGADGLAIARGSLGNPWIFKEITEYLKKGKVILRPSLEKVIKVMLEHLAASVAFYGERNGVIIFRKFFGWYTKGIRSIRPLREKSSRVKTQEEMAGIISSL